MVRRDTTARVEDVWAVLADGWLYASWVVGASTIRDVDATWPAPGSRIHHSVGLWPILIKDKTVVLESTPDQQLVLQARGWPLGEARVDIRLEPHDDGGCTIVIDEEPTHGPGVLSPHALREVAIGPRNRETLYRLALLAEGRAAQGHSGTGGRHR